MVLYEPTPKDRRKMRQRRWRRKLVKISRQAGDSIRLILRAMTITVVVALLLYGGVKLKYRFTSQPTVTPSSAEQEHWFLFLDFRNSEESLAFYGVDLRPGAARIFRVPDDVVLNEETGLSLVSTAKESPDLARYVLSKLFHVQKSGYIIVTPDLVFKLAALGGDLNVMFDKPVALKWKQFEGPTVLDPLELKLVVDSLTEWDAGPFTAAATRLASLRQIDSPEYLYLPESTDLSRDEFSLVFKLAASLDREKIDFRNFPVMKKGGKTVPDPGLLDFFLSEPIPDARSLKLNRTVRIEIFNATGIPGLAARWKDGLERNPMIEVSRIGNLSSQRNPRFMMVYSPGLEDEARQISTLFNRNPQSRKLRLATSDIRIIFGADYGNPGG